MPIPGLATARAIRIGIWTGGILLGVLSLFAATLAGFYIWFSLSTADLEGTVAVEGITARVEIVRDRNGVPHVFAATPQDAYFAQGYVHAQDRLFQMDAMRMLARGRLAEVVGRPGLASDRFMRGIGLVDHAQASLETMDASVREILDAYAQGVNALMTSPDVGLPPEYSITGRRPEPWTALDSLLWGQVMALQLSGNWREELIRARVAASHPIDVVTLLWPEAPAAEFTTITELAKAWRLPALDRMMAQLPEPLGPSQASNGWVVAGTRTASGKPLLANDPHLPLVAPSAWYLIRLEAPGGFRRVGASAPGVPGVVLGHNGRVAWGMTTTGADTFDLFLERVTEDNSATYETPSGPVAFDTREHEIRIRDEETPYRMTVRRTRHGVVLSDITGDVNDAAMPGHVLVLAGALFQAPNKTGEALLRLNAARSVDAGLAALSAWTAPVQNVFLADVDGRIAIAASGIVPKRRNGDGTVPVPGWNGDYDWSELITAEALPRSIDPESGLLINANNRLIGGDAPVFITHDWDAPYRGLRLSEGIGDSRAEDIRTARTWQLDHTSIFARSFLEALAGWSPTEPDLRYFMTMLREWDHAAARDRPEPLIFNAWMRTLRAAILRGLIGAQAEALLARSSRDFPHLLIGVASNEGEVCARLDCRQLIASTLRETRESLSAGHGDDRFGWRWGSTHVAAFEHPVWSRVPYLRNWFRFAVSTDGDNYTVNRGTASQRDGLTRFPHVHGPGLRAIYDLADLDRAQFIITPGQSGHPLSPHWGDLATLWANGRYVTIAGARDDIRVDGTTLFLTPR